MAEYTHKTLSYKLATELMGWVKCHRGTDVGYCPKGWEDDHDSLFIKLHEWQPSRPEGVAQALECLREWKAQKPKRYYGICEPCDVDLACCVLNEIVPDCVNLVGTATHKHLATASCLALASALDGEQATIKE